MRPITIQIIFETGYKAMYHLQRMTKKLQQVIPNLRSGWSVKSYGSTRAMKTFKTQAEALAWARERCKRNGLALSVHGRDGSVRYWQYADRM